MRTTPSLALIKARARRDAKALDEHMKRRIDALTHHGKRSLTKYEIEQLSREGARFLRNRIR